MTICVAIRAPEERISNEKYDENNPNHMEYPISAFSGDTKLYYGLLHTLRHIYRSEKSPVSKKAIKKMEKLLIGEVTLIDTPAFARQGNANPYDKTGYVHQPGKVNEHVQGLDYSYR